MVSVVTKIFSIYLIVLNSHFNLKYIKNLPPNLNTQFYVKAMMNLNKISFVCHAIIDNKDVLLFYYSYQTHAIYENIASTFYICFTFHKNLDNLKHLCHLQPFAKKKLKMNKTTESSSISCFVKLAKQKCIIM